MTPVLMQSVAAPNFCVPLCMNMPCVGIAFCVHIYCWLLQQVYFVLPSASVLGFVLPSASVLGFVDSFSQYARLCWFPSASMLGFVGSFNQCARLCWFLQPVH